MLIMRWLKDGDAYLSDFLLNKRRSRRSYVPSLHILNSLTLKLYDYRAISKFTKCKVTIIYPSFTGNLTHMYNYTGLYFNLKTYHESVYVKVLAKDVCSQMTQSCILPAAQHCRYIWQVSSIKGKRPNICASPDS